MIRLIDADALKRRLIKRREEIASERRYGWEWEYNGLNCAILLTGCEAVENPIRPEPHWIPVTEATPTEDDEYWCTFGVKTGWFVDWCDWYQGRWVVWTDNTVSEVRNVIAWCKPLEPYKGVTDGND